MELTLLPRQTSDEGAPEETGSEPSSVVTDNPADPTPDPSGGDGDGGSSDGGGGGSSDDSGGSSGDNSPSEEPSSEPSQPPSEEPSNPPSSEPSSEPSSAPSSQPPSSRPPSSSHSSAAPPAEPSSEASSRSPNSPQPSPTPSPSPTSTSSTITSFSPSTSNTAPLDMTSSGNYSTIITVINGQSTTIYSPIPTDLSDDDYSGSDRQRAAIIGGATAAGVVLIILLIGGVFVFKRAQKRRLGFIEALHRGSRENKGAGSIGLLDGEFDDDREHVMQQYRDLPISGATPTTPTSRHTRSASQQSPTPSLFRAQASNSGSMFHESVWPPPSPSSRFVDPFMKSSSEVDLGHIVDDVMGGHSNAPTAYHPLISGHNASASDISATSIDPLLPHPGSSGLPPGAAAPKRPSPLVQNVAESTSSHGSHSPTQPWIQRTPKKA